MTGLVQSLTTPVPVAQGGTGVTASTGTVAVVLSTSPTLVTPVLGVATATSVAVGGATLGTNAIAVTGTTQYSALVTVNANAAATSLMPVVGTAPLLQLANVDGTGTKLSISAFGAGAPSIAGNKAQGTMGTPSATLAFDVFMNINGGGYANGAYTGSKASITLSAASVNWTASDNSTQIGFNTVPNGSTSLSSAMSLTSYGLLLGSNVSGYVLSTTNALTNGAAAAVGTLTNAPAAGNPTKWIQINDAGTVRNIPAW